MSAAGTPSTDPWVILARERVRYEEQFKSLKPINGVVTGDQAKGFFLQSQLPPPILGQIWALADTDADGKMDINEFSIACKLINLKLRGFEVPKVLPPQLIASLRIMTPPAIPPLPNPALVSAPARPEPPKAAPVISQTPLSQSQPLLAQGPPLVPNLPISGIPTGVIPPMTSSMPASQPLVGGFPPIIQSVPPIPAAGQAVPTIPPLSVSQQMGTVGIQPVKPMVPPAAAGFGTMVPGSTMAAPPLVSTAPLVTGVPPMPVVPPMGAVPPVLPGSTTLPTAVLPPLSSGTTMSPLGSAPIPSSVVGPGATSTPRTSITSLDRAASIESPQVEWAVPHQTKLKYTQIFNTMDRARTGYLSGAQARNVMVQTKLPQNVLAQIWALSDMDSDGRLGCEEFVLAMHLCEQASLGHLPPTVLPPDLVPPSFRRAPRTASVSSQGSVHQLEQDPASTLPQTSFEDKRKENFEKGQAELERRRKALLDQQRKEAEERERKEREEQEKKEKARLEAERKRMEELEKQMREQQEQERLKEEERKRQAEQREAARREMERQRQLEWEKQRLQELQQQRQREQENVLKLKSKNQSLTIELSSLNEQVKELSQKICDTRVGVSNVKSTIDGMRSTRDAQMQEMSQLKNKLKEQNAKLLMLSQEKAKLDAKNKLNAAVSDETKQAFDNKEVTIKNLKEKLEDMQKQIDGKMADIENNNSQLTELRTQLMNLVSECETLYGTYEEKKNKVLEMKGSSRNADYTTAWKDSGSWAAEDTQAPTEWPVDNWGSSAQDEVSEVPVGKDVVRYRAIYEFVARNNDEVSFQPGDIINVPTEQTGEPGWLAGEIRGHTGWFPESYVEPIDGATVTYVTQSATTYDDVESKRLEGIAEVPEINDNHTSIQQPTNDIQEEIEYYIANYPYQSIEQGDLTFNAGDMIAVLKKDGEWWTGKIGDNVGIFPSNYVQKVDVNTATNSAAEVTKSAVESANTAQQEASYIVQADNEVSQITSNKLDEKPDFAAMASNTQTLKGKKPEIASVIAPYQATSSEQLSLARGQLIMIRKKTDSGWWEGELQAKGKKRQVGWFPASYVKVLNSSGRTSGRTTPVSASRMQQEVVIDKVVALYPYTAANPDELSFLKDDIISVTAREEPAWWRGELNGVSGLFPSNYVTPLQSQSPYSYQDKMRLDCINELIQTERTYIDDMTVVHKVFEKPLSESRVVTQNEIEGIFVNWREILQCNKNFLADLLTRRDTGSDIIGDIICAHLPRMTSYITFCSKQLESAALLQKLTETSHAFRDVVRRCQNNVLTRGMPLSSFLIKPMQRITKYPLLITKILENTPNDHPDHEYLQEALRVADRFLKLINENVRIKENQDRLEWLQHNVQMTEAITFNSATNKLGQRKLLHYGNLIKVKSGKELIGFLFNDFFMLIQPSKTLGNTQFIFQRNNNITYKLYKQPILIQDLTAQKGSTDHVENGTDANRVLKICDKNKQTISVLASTANDCNLWLKQIEGAKDVYNSVTSLVKSRPKSKSPLGATCGRLFIHIQNGRRFIKAVHVFARAWLLVTVVEGSEIYARQPSYKNSKKKGKAHVENVYCKVFLGDQQQQTDVAKENIINGNSIQNGVPQVPTLTWNHSMQFHVRNLNEDILSLAVYEMCPFSPDEFLGRAEIKIRNIYNELHHTNGPIIRKLILHQVESGEVVVKLDLQMFTNQY